MNCIQQIGIILFLLFTTIYVHAQESVHAIGGNAFGAGGSSSYTIGQVVYTTNTTLNGSVAQGVQQPYEIYTSVGIEITEINLELLAYPNPTNNNLTLIIGNHQIENLTYQLYDLQGKLLENNQMLSKRTVISMQNLPVATYILNIQDRKSLIKTFRIIKK